MSHRLDYQGEPPADAATGRAAALRWIAIAMACAWPLVMGMAGVSADFTYIPVGKKIILSLSAIIVAALLHITGGRKRQGCALVFVLVAICMLGPRSA